jgi:hypothetical protein
MIRFIELVFLHVELRSVLYNVRLIFMGRKVMPCVLDLRAFMTPKEEYNSVTIRLFLFSD